MRKALGNDIVGKYLCGSVALNDVAHKASAADMIMLNADELSN
jgi:hypothetical protein